MASAAFASAKGGRAVQLGNHFVGGRATGNALGLGRTGGLGCASCAGVVVSGLGCCWFDLAMVLAPCSGRATGRLPVVDVCSLQHPLYISPGRRIAHLQGVCLGVQQWAVGEAPPLASIRRALLVE